MVRRIGDPSPEASARPRNPLEYEQGFRGRGASRIAGVDEVGRGPLAGPVVACAVVLPADVCIDGADDSKRLTGPRRRALAAAIRASGASIGLGAASPREIDRLNILRATTLAMRRALAALPQAPDHIVVDGRPVRGLGLEHDAVVGGDGLVHCISCASIVAKVLRDDLMQRLAERYPGYGWHTNMGYGTKAHRDALERHGPTPHHRRSFLGLQHTLEF